MKPIIHLDRTGGGVSDGWDGQVEFRGDLPITLGSPLVGDIYLIEKPTTILLGIYTTYQSGLYIRDFNNGNLNDWRRLNVKVNFTDGEFAIVNSADESKRAKLDVSNISASTTRTVYIQDKDGTFAYISDLPVFGSHYTFSVSEDESTNSTETPISKVLLTTANIPSGIYRGQVSAEVSNSSTAGKVGLIVEFDGVEINDILKEPKDITDTLNWSPFGVQELTAGVHTIEILFYNVGSGTASIKKTRVELYRIQ